MKRSALTTLILLLLVTSCAPAPPETPTVAPTAVAARIATATATETPMPTSTYTDTPVPTATPTDISMPTATFTNTPMPTATPTETPTLTATSTDTPAPTLTPTPLPPLPELYVDGPFIRRRDTEEAVQFKGANIKNFDNVNPPTCEGAKKYVDIAKGYGMNILRAQLDLKRVEKYQNELEKLVDYAELNGMYVILSPATDNGEPIHQPTQRSHDTIVQLARCFNGRTNILYGLLNEAGDIDGNWWYDEAVRIVRDIRNVNPNSILVMSGTQWNRNYSFLKGRPLPDPNMICDVHNYFRKYDDAGNDITSQYMDWEWMIGQYPLIITEGGVPGHKGGREHELDAVYNQRVVDMVKQHPQMIHWVVFEMAPGGWETSIFNKDGSVSSRGKPYIEDLNDPTSPPVTEFTQ